MKRMTLEDFLAKLDWEGNDYAIHEMSSKEMPDEELEKLHEEAKKAYRNFFNAVRKREKQG